MSAGDEVAHTRSPALNKTRDGRRRNKSFAKVQGHINGSRPFQMLLDSGAAANFIDSSVVDALGLRRFPVDEVIVAMANGSTERSSHIVKINIEIHGTSVPSDFRVIRLPDIQVVLGEDFLVDGQVVMDYSTGNIQIQGKVIATTGYPDEQPSTGYDSIRIISFFSMRIPHDSTHDIRLHSIESTTDDVLSWHVPGLDNSSRLDPIVSTYLDSCDNATQPPDRHTHTDLLTSAHLFDMVFLEAATDAQLEKHLFSTQVQDIELEGIPSARTMAESFMNTSMPSPNLNVEENARLSDILTENHEVISPVRASISEYVKTLPRCRLTLAEGKSPVAARFYRMDAGKLTFLKSLLAEYQEKGLIEPSTAPYASPAMLVAKKVKGEWRLVVDYRDLNSKLVPNNYPLPSCEQALDAIGASGARIMSLFDLTDGYNNMLMADEESKDLTTFTTPLGAWRFLVLAQGLCVAPSAFQNFMDGIFRDSINSHMVVYLDDILIYSRSHKEHLDHLSQFFDTAKKSGLRVKASKSHLFTTEADFLGHKIKLSDGVCEIRAQSSKTEAISSWITPRSNKQLQQFLGLANYYNRLIPNYAEIAAPLTSIAATTWGENDYERFWKNAENEAFEKLKKALTSDNVVISPRLDVPFIIEADASRYCVGGAIMQHIENADRVVAYVSHKLPETAQRWPTHERELFALVYIVKKYMHLFRGQKVIYRGDHKPLLALRTQTHLSDKMHRWLYQVLNEVQWEMVWTKGADLVVADALSRNDESDNVKSRFEHTPELEALYSILMNTDIPLENRDQLLAKECSSDDDFLRREFAKTGTANTHSFWTYLNAISRSVPSWDSASTSIGVYSHLDVTPELKNLIQDALLEDDLGRQVLAGEHLDGLYSTNDLVYKRRADVPGSHPVLYIPSQALHVHHLLISLAHEDMLTAHANARATLDKLMRFFFWDNMSVHVEKFVRTCDVCARCAINRRKNVIPFKFSTPNHAFEVIAIDEVRLTPTHSGNTGVWVIVDALTGRCILVPTTSSTTAERLCSILFQHVVSKWGFPTRIISDKGPQFDSDVYKRLLETLHIKRNMSSAETPTTAGLVERKNQDVIHVLRKYATTYPEEWDVLLPAVEFALNDSPRTSTGGYTPFQLSTGRSPSIPIGALFHEISKPSLGDKDNTALTYLNSYMKAIKLARSTLRLYNDQSYLKRLAQSPVPNFYAPNELVWYDNRAGAKTHGKKLSKLEPTKDGPYRIISKGHMNTYFVDPTPQHGSTSPPLSCTMPVNGRHLSSFHEREEPDLDDSDIGTSDSLNTDTIPADVSDHTTSDDMDSTLDTTDVVPTVTTRSVNRRLRQEALERLTMTPDEEEHHFPRKSDSGTIRGIKSTLPFVSVERHVEILDHRFTTGTNSVTFPEYRVKWNEEGVVSDEWIHGNEFIRFNTYVAARFDSLTKYLDSTFGHNDSLRSPIPDNPNVEDLLLRRLYRENPTHIQKGRKCKSDLKSRRAFVTECRQFKDENGQQQIEYSWINRRGDHGRFIKYLPGCFEKMTSDTLNARLTTRGLDNLVLNLLSTRKEKSRKIRILVGFSGKKSVSKMLTSLHLLDKVELITFDINAKYEPDYVLDILKWETWSNTDFPFPARYFDIVWLSPPCTEYSPSLTTRERRIDLANQLIMTTRRFLTYLDPAVWFMENQASGKFALHHQPCMKDWNALRNEVTYCRYGYAYCKPTSIWSNLDLSVLNLKSCKTTPCLQRLIEVRHSVTAQSGPSRDGTPGTPVEQSMTVPPRLLQILFEHAVSCLYLELPDLSPLRKWVSINQIQCYPVCLVDPPFDWSLTPS